MNEIKNDKIIAIRFKTEKSKLSEEIIFFRPNKLTAASVGIDNKKDIFAESYLSKFNILAAEIVIPDLLTPGINDKTCKKPINNADLIEKSFFSFLSVLKVSEK